jgi:hypothetical protein
MILLFINCHENLKSNITLCTPSSRKENIMGVLRRIFGSMQEEMGWRKLCDEEPHNLYSSLHNITVLKEDKMLHAYGQGGGGEKKKRAAS